LDTGEVVTLGTWTFAINFIQSSTPAAHALICPDARYIAIRWQDGRLDRRELSSTLWQVLEQELAHDPSPAPVSRSSMISTCILNEDECLVT
jgi:hypothetical protein